jgi:hypothetical protein
MSLAGSFDPFTYGLYWDSINLSGANYGPGQGGGTVTVKGATRFYKIDQKDGSGQDGAVQTYRGQKPKAFKLLFHVWTSDQYTLYDAFSRAFFTYSGVKGIVFPYDIIHPALIPLGISQVIIEEWGALEKVNDQLLFLATVTVRQYLPPPPINATDTPIAASAVPPTPGAPPVDPTIVALKARQAQLKAQIAAGPPPK